MSDHASAADALPELTLYGRAACHLCHEMASELEGLARLGASFRVTQIDVDSSLALKKRFGAEVPVLMAGETQLCRHRLDRKALDAYLHEFL
jgi:Glutaredoxin-like domain (DUF836)